MKKCETKKKIEPCTLPKQEFNFKTLIKQGFLTKKEAAWIKQGMDIGIRFDMRFNYKLLFGKYPNQEFICDAQIFRSIQ